MKEVSAVVNEFLSLGEEITPLKLVKLCYFAQGYSLAILNRPIFTDDKIEAWKYGPVVPSVYHEFKHFVNNPITGRSVKVIIGDDLELVMHEPKLTDEEDKKIVQAVWNMYGKYHPNKLVDMTHKAGTPWGMTYVPSKNREIPNELIKKYYKIIVSEMKNGRSR